MDLLTTRTFNGVALDCYKGDDNSDFWATREQVGRLLGYENPRKAIAIIHTRNKERLDKFSKGVQIETPSRGLQSATVYNFKGLLEICRYSNQPAANAVIDFLWDVADDIRKHGMYMSDKLQDTAKVDPKRFNAVVKKYLVEKDKVKALTEQIAADAPYTVIGKIVQSLPGAMTPADAAQSMRQRGIRIGRNTLYRILRDKEYLSVQKKRWNKPTQKGIDSGIVNIALTEPGVYILSPHAMITEKGLEKIYSELFSEKYPLAALWEFEEEDDEIAEAMEF